MALIIDEHREYLDQTRLAAFHKGYSTHVDLPEKISLVNWNVDVLNGNAGSKKDSFRHSTWKGMLIPAEDLQRTQPGFKPKLTPRGEGRRTVVNLCDGVRTLTEIADEVFRLHPDLFRNREEAAVFVAEVVTRYSE